MIDLSGNSSFMHRQKQAKMFEEWKLQYDRMIYHLLHQFQIKYDFDEFYQLALIRLWQLEKSYDSERSPNRDQFVYLKLKFYIIDELRKKIKYQQRHPVTSDEALISLIDCQYNSYASLYLEGIPELLSEDERIWFQYALSGYKISEIALLTNKSPSTIKRWRKNAREKICKNNSLTFKNEP